jgi:hypothetical protein
MGFEKLRTVPVFNKYQINHHAYIDILGLTKQFPIWFDSMGYDFWESGVKEKPIGTGDYLEVDWTAEKDVSFHMRFTIKIKFWIRDLRKVTLESGEETFYGRAQFIIDTALVKDYENRFHKFNKWQEFLRQFYERYIAKEQLHIKFFGQLVMESMDLSNMIRSFLH